MTSISSSTSGLAMLALLPSSMVEAIVWGGGGGGGASIRHGAFISGERLKQTVYLKKALIRQIRGVYLRVGVY